MTVTARTAQHLDDLATEIIANYRPAIAQLHQWTAGHPSATIGASPPTEPSNPDNEPDNGLTPDHAQQLLHRLDNALTTLADTGRQLWAEHDGTELPPHQPDDAGRLAIIMWTVRRIARDRHAIASHHAETYARQLEAVANTCRLCQPPPHTRIIDACHAHTAAGATAAISINYRRHHLCDWCGRFRHIHNVNPPPAIVRLHDKGVKMSTTILRRNGIRPTQTRRSA